MRRENLAGRCPECGQRLYFDYNALSWTCTNPGCRTTYRYEEFGETPITGGNETRHGRSRPRLELSTDNHRSRQTDVYGGLKPSYGSPCRHRTTYETKRKSRRVPVITGVTLACLFAVVAFTIITDPFTPTLSADPLGFDFSVSDGLDPHTQILELESSGRAITWSVMEDAWWLDIDRTDGSTDEGTPLTLSVDISGMYPGEYSATITIYASRARNELIEIPARLVITETEETLAIKEAVGGDDGDLRIHYDEQTPYSGVRLINNPSATNPTFGELLRFIESDDTNERLYVEGEYMCADFAETLHNNAEQEGIRAAWVGVDFEGESVGHALNAFHTLGIGLVFVDCTGGGFDVLIPSSKHDTIAYVRVGAQYGLVSSDIALWPSYDFYERYSQDWQDYERRVEEYSERVDEYNALVRGRTVIDNPLEYSRLKAMYDELEAERVALESLGESLGEYRWESLGVVSHVEIYW